MITRSADYLRIPIEQQTAVTIIVFDNLSTDKYFPMIIVVCLWFVYNIIIVHDLLLSWYSFNMINNIRKMYLHQNLI